MGRQFSYYALPRDFHELDKYFVSKMDAVILDYYSDSAEPTILRSRENNSNVPDRVFTFVCRASDLDSIRCKYIPTQEHWILVSDYSPIVQYTRGPLLDGILRPGRFYYRTADWRGEEWVEQDPSFVKWAERFFRYTKKRMKFLPFTYNKHDYVDKIYVGEHALDWYLNKGGKFELQNAEVKLLLEG